MIVKILRGSSQGFAGVTYNTHKVERGKGELLITANFGALQGLHQLRPQDYVHYLQMVSAPNKRIVQPQFHVVFSSKGSLYDKATLAATAEQWLQEMGYGQQPYLVVFHKDTGHHHVHAVTTRVGRDGRKINSAYEKIRAVKALDKVLGYEYALQYRFSTKAQFYLLLETQGFAGKDYPEQKLQQRIDRYQPDKARLLHLRQLFEQHKARSDFVTFAAAEWQLEIIFHAAEGKPPYGYSVIDHETRQVFKGSEILSLKHLLAVADLKRPADIPLDTVPVMERGYDNTQANLEQAPPPVYIRPVAIADDVDDEAILGRNRRRKRKARTNTR